METFIIGAALSATSLGTTFVVISGATTGLDFVQTRVGIVLVSAALLDDIVGLIMVRCVSSQPRTTLFQAAVRAGSD